MNKLVSKWNAHAAKQQAEPVAQNRCCDGLPCDHCQGHGTVATHRKGQIDVTYCPHCQGAGVKSGESK